MECPLTGRPDISSEERPIIAQAIEMACNILSDAQEGSSAYAFPLLSMTVFWCPRSYNPRRRRAHWRRNANLFRSGQILPLWHQLVGALTEAAAAAREKLAALPSKNRTQQAVMRRIMQGELSRATQRLSHAPILKVTEAVRTQMDAKFIQDRAPPGWQVPLKEQRATFAEDPWRNMDAGEDAGGDLLVSNKAISDAIHLLPKSTSPDPQGMWPQYFKLVRDEALERGNSRPLEALCDMLRHTVHPSFPEAIIRDISRSRLAPVPKQGLAFWANLAGGMEQVEGWVAANNPDVDARPVVIGTLLRRIIGKACVMEHKPEIVEAVGPSQFGVGHSGGGEQPSFVGQLLLESRPDYAVLLLDARNAFNEVKRNFVVSDALDRLGPMGAAAVGMYLTPTEIHLKLDNGQTHIVSSEDGGHQGDPFLGVLFANTEEYHVLRHLRELLPEGAVLALMDDVQLLGRPEVLLAIKTDHMVPLFASMGLTLNLDKMKLLVPHPELAPQGSIDPAAWAPIPIVNDGVIIGGVPVGSDEYVLAEMGRIATMYCAELDRLHILESHQAKFMLLRMCYIPRMMHLARSVRPDLSQLALRQYDEAVEACVRSILGVEHLSPTQRSQAYLPLRYGGLGLRRLADIRHQAYLARALLALETGLGERVPAIAACLNEMLHLDWPATTPTMVALRGALPAMGGHPTLPHTAVASLSLSGDDLLGGVVKYTRRDQQLQLWRRLRRAAATAASDAARDEARAQGLSEADATAAGVAAANQARDMFANDNPMPPQAEEGVAAPRRQENEQDVLDFCRDPPCSHADDEGHHHGLDCLAEAYAQGELRKFQRVATHSRDAWNVVGLLETFADEGNAADRARLRSVVAPSAGAWLLALPVGDNTMTNFEFTYALRARIGLPMLGIGVVRPLCDCGHDENLHQDTNHLEICRRDAQRSQCHNQIKHKVSGMARAAGVAVQEEVMVYGDELHPHMSADNFFPGNPAANGQDTAVDVRLTHPESAYVKAGAADRGGYACRQSSMQKGNKYLLPAHRANIKFISFVLERYGRWSSGASRLLNMFARHAESMGRASVACFKAKWRVRISVSLQKAYARASKYNIRALAVGAGHEHGVDGGDLEEHIVGIGG